MELPDESLGYFSLNFLLIWLMLTYSMPLATVYSFMVLLDAVVYLFVSSFHTFTWIPFAKKGEPKLMKIIVGIVFGIGFLYIYNYISKAPMAAVFATTAFGDSKLLTILVYTALIAPVETRLFFRTAMQVIGHLLGKATRVSPFSSTGIFLEVFFGAIFTAFHFTAKGITNTPELVATFVFGALSVGMILYFQEWIQASIMHILVNGRSMNIFDYTAEIFHYWYSWVIIITIGYFMYVSAKRKGMSVFSI